MEFLKSTDSKVIEIDSCVLKFNCDNTCCLISSPNIYSHFAELHYVNMKEELLFPPVIIDIDTFNLCVYFIQSMVTLYGYLVTDKHHTAEQTGRYPELKILNYLKVWPISYKHRVSFSGRGKVYCINIKTYNIALHVNSCYQTLLLASQIINNT